MKVISFFEHSYKGFRWGNTQVQKLCNFLFRRHSKDQLGFCFLLKKECSFSFIASLIS